MKRFCLSLALPVLLLASRITYAQTAESLLNESFGLSQKLNGPERLFFFTELTRVMTKTSVPEEQAENWCMTLFRIASANPDERSRIANQKNALANLSFFNPALALQLLNTVDLQKSGADHWQYEDYRANAAQTIFVNFIEKTKPRGISILIQSARYIGRTGQYPYRALGSVIEHLPQVSIDDVNIMLDDALTFYSGETGYLNRDEEFLELLKTLYSVNNTSIDQNLVAKLLSTFADRVTREPVPFTGRYYSEIHLPNNIVVPFTDRNQAFLFQILPAARRYNHELADRLLQTNPTLGQATDGMISVAGGFVLGNPTSDEATRQHLQWVQRSIVDRIKECNQVAPQAAARLSQRLTEVSTRIVGFSSTVPGLYKQNPTEALVVYNTQIAELNNVTDPLERVRATVALAKAAHDIQDLKTYHGLSIKAQGLAVQLFTSDTVSHPDVRVQRRPGFDELKELTIFTASQSDDILFNTIQALPDNNWLKAYLLLYEAEGRARAPATSAKQVVCTQ